MFGLVSKRRIESTLNEMRWRSSKEGYVRREAQDGYRFAISEFERLLGVRAARPGLHQTQKGGDGSVMFMAGGDISDLDL